jgi:hypothetical protein
MGWVPLMPPQVLPHFSPLPLRLRKPPPPARPHNRRTHPVTALRKPVTPARTLTVFRFV